MLLLRRWSALLLLLCLVGMSWSSKAHAAATCIQYGGTTPCYEPPTVYYGQTSWGTNTYTTPPSSSFMGAAYALAGYVIGNGSASVGRGCTSTITAEPDPLANCNYGVVTGNISGWWNPSTMYCVFWGWNTPCGYLIATAYTGPALIPGSLSATIYGWGYGGLWYGNGPSMPPFQTYNFASLGSVIYTVYCNADDSKVTDQDSAGYFHYLCRPAPTASPQPLPASASDGNMNCRVCSAHPVDLITAQKVDYVQDVVIDAPFPIVWDRSFTQGMGWHFGYDRSITVSSPDNSGNVVAQATRENGSVLTFAGTANGEGSGYTWALKGNYSSGSVVANGAYVTTTLHTVLNGAGQIQSFTLNNALDQQETYGATGQLQTLTDREGHVLTFSENANGKITQITDQFGHALTVTYPMNLQSVSVTFADPTSQNGGTITNQGLYWNDPISQQGELWPSQVSDGHQTVKYGYTAITTPEGGTATSVSPALVTVTHPDGTTLTYSYGELLNLSISGGTATVSSANAPSTGTPPYSYAPPNYLTGITAEDGTRLETVFYQNSGYTSGETRGGIYSPLRFGGNSVTDPAGTNFSFKNNGGQQAGGPYQGQCPAILCQGMDTQWVSMSYDTTGQPTSLQDYVGNTETRIHEPVRGLMTSRTEAANSPTLARTTTYTWDSRFRLPDTVTEPIKVGGIAGTRTTTYTYDNQGHVLTETVAPSSGEPPRVSTYTYDGDGFLSTETDPSGAVTAFQYNDSTGQLQGWMDALGHTTTVGNYTAEGQPQQTLDANGLETDVVYDINGRPTRVRRGSAATHWETTQIVYQASGTGLVDNLVMKDGRQMVFAYNQAQWLMGTALKDSGGHLLGTITYTRSNVGEETGEVWQDASGNTIKAATTTYDTLHRLSTSVGSAGQTTTVTYDPQSRPLTVKDPNGNTVKRTYDALGRVATLTDGLGHAVTLAYDPQDALVQAVDVRGNATTYTDNGFGDRLSVVSPDRGTWTFTVDGAGRRTGVHDPRGATTAIAYDLLDRPTQVVYDSTPVALGTVGVVRTTETQTFTYDTCPNGVGHLCVMTDASGATAYTYDLWGRLTGESFVPADNASVSLTTGYGYNTGGQLVSIVYPSGRTLFLSYGTDGQISGETWEGNPVLMGVTHRPLGGEVTGWQWGSASAGSETFTYDTDGQLTGMNDANTGGTSRTLDYDLGGRLQNVTVTGQALWNQGYTYDENDRLTGATLGGFPGALSYGYDSNGNRTSFGNNGTTLTNTYAPTSNRLLSTQVAPGAAASPVWDSAGNLINDGQGLALAYDAKNRFVQANNGAMSAQYTYDASGNRVEKQVTGSQSVQERYVYDPSGLLLGVYDASGNPIEETAYLDDGRPVAVARPITGSPGSWTVYPILTDQLGTPRQILDPVAGSPVWEWEAKEPFGNELPNQTVSGTTFVYRGRFPGQVYDPETGLLHNGFRDYLPSCGCYVQSDPMGLDAGWNTYAYVLDSPGMGKDLSGLYPRVWKDGNNVQITLSIRFIGDDASQTRISSVEQAIEMEWTGVFGKYQVTTKVVPGDDNVIGLSSGNGISAVFRDQISGVWYSHESDGTRTSAWTCTHEAGHLMGLPDRYTNGTYPNGKRKTTPLPGWENDIMGNRNMRPSEEDIREIIERSEKVSPTW